MRLRRERSTQKMKIVCKQNELNAAINIVLKAVSSKTTMAILECIFIEAKEGKIKLTTNNMELGIETLVPGKIDEEGKFAINAKMFSEIVRKMPDSMISIDVNENYAATIKCGKAKFNISCQSGSDFPVLPEVKRDNVIKISQFSLKEIIRQTIFAVSESGSNTSSVASVMTGEYFEINGNELKVTALDGHRIAIRKIELKESYEDHSMIIPGKSLIEISKILTDDTEKEINIFYSNNNAMFEIEDTLVLTRLVEGKYLNVKQMIRNDYDIKVKINKKELFDCIDRATLLVKESDKKPVIIDIKEDVISLNMNTSLGSLDEEIFVEKDGKDIMIGLNPKFMLDVIKVIDDEEICIYMTNAKAPCFIRDDNESYNYVILPVNFSTAR